MLPESSFVSAHQVPRIEAVPSRESATGTVDRDSAKRSCPPRLDFYLARRWLCWDVVYCNNASSVVFVRDIGTAAYKRESVVSIPVVSHKVQPCLLWSYLVLEFNSAMYSWIWRKEGEKTLIQYLQYKNRHALSHSYSKHTRLHADRCTYACAHTHTHIHTHTHTHTNTQYIHTHEHTHTHPRAHTCPHIHTRTQALIHSCTCLCARMHLQAHKRALACVRTHTHTQTHTQSHTHPYKHTHPLVSMRSSIYLHIYLMIWIENKSYRNDKLLQMTQSCLCYLIFLCVGGGGWVSLIIQDNRDKLKTFDWEEDLLLKNKPLIKESISFVFLAC